VQPERAIKLATLLETPEMNHSTDRILTSHVGSLIRPQSVVDYLRAKQAGQPVDEAAHQSKLKDEVRDVVAQQKTAGIDIPSDGEFGKGISWSQYVIERMSVARSRGTIPGVAAPTARDSPPSTTRWTQRKAWPRRWILSASGRSNTLAKPPYSSTSTI
jgi:hypothetical protein